MRYSRVFPFKLILIHSACMLTSHRSSILWAGEAPGRAMVPPFNEKSINDEKLPFRDSTYGEAGSCPRTLLKIYYGRIFAGRTYDKWKHCYASCLLARQCDPLQASAAGLLKEFADFVGSEGLLIARKLRAPWWIVGFFQRIKGEPDLEDLLADGRGIVCGSGEASCRECCDTAYP